MARLTSPGHRDTRECCTIYKAAAAEHISQQEKRKRVCKNTCLDSSVKGRTIDHQQPLRCRFRSPKLSVAAGGGGGGVNESCCHCVTVFSAQRTTEKVLQEERQAFAWSWREDLVSGRQVAQFAHLHCLSAEMNASAKNTENGELHWPLNAH